MKAGLNRLAVGELLGSQDAAAGVPRGLIEPGPTPARRRPDASERNHIAKAIRMTAGRTGATPDRNL